jgi:serine/threonine protein kinase
MHLMELLLGDYSLVGVVGKGGFADVYRVRSRRGAKAHFAAKVYRREMDVRISSEVRAMQTLRASSRAPTLYDVYDNDAECVLVMDLYDEDLAKYAMGKKEMRDPSRFVCGAAQCVAECHDRMIVHGDVNFRNLMLQDSEVRLVDFGLAVHADDYAAFPAYTGKTQGTPYFISPESVKQGVVSYSNDVWALGVFAYYLLRHEPLVGGKTARDILRNTGALTSATLCDRLSEIDDARAADFVAQCLDLNHATRVTAEQALQHDWMQPTIEG